MANLEVFRSEIITGGLVMDPEGVHHEFVSGLHGQKLDFDNIPEDSELYRDWVGVNVDFIRNTYTQIPGALIGVANGTNRLARDVGAVMFGETTALPSAKDPENSKRLYLPEYTHKFLEIMQPKLAIVLEDVGTTGSNSVQVAEAALDAGAEYVEVVLTWQRRAQLERLREAKIPYRSIIEEALPTFTPGVDGTCATDPNGFCARGWEFIAREK